MSTIYDQTYLDRLDRMIASGVLSSGWGSERVQFRTMDELLRARSHVAEQIAAASAGAPRRMTRETSFMRGDKP